MADLFDVEKALLAALDAAFFDGTPNRSALTPTNIQMRDGSYLAGRVYRGWPLPNRLPPDLAAGGFHISIYSVPNVQRNEPRFHRDFEALPRPPIMLTATTSGSTVTLSGQGASGQVVGIAVGQTGYSVRIASEATPEALAASLAAMIPGAVAAGSSVEISAPGAISAGVVADTTMLRPLQTQVQRFLVSIWAPSDAARVAIQGRLLPPILGPDSFAMPDGSVTGPAVHRGVSPMKQNEKDAAYVAQNAIDIEYTTTETKVFPGVLFVGLELGDHRIGVFPPGS